MHRGGFDPWEELRQRPHIELGIVPLPRRLGGGVWWPTDDGGALVLLDRDLDRAGRRAVLTHELLHDEQGGGCADHPWAPPGWGAVVCREENRIHEEVARRLVPTAELEKWCRARESAGVCTTAADVAEEFEVPVHVASRALRQLSSTAP